MKLYMCYYFNRSGHACSGSEPRDFLKGCFRVVLPAAHCTWMPAKVNGIEIPQLTQLFQVLGLLTHQ